MDYRPCTLESTAWNLLYIAYRLDIKTWSVKGDNKIAMETKKKQIQSKFRQQMGLIIDRVKQGSGTSNDGNTARRFFGFPEKTAAITALDEQLVRRIGVILQAISSGESIDTHKFQEYARATSERYVELYDWYYIPATLHKILIHCADIANVSVIPIGKLSEEASEARNKDFCRYRVSRARKSSRTNTNQDILNMLLLSSDPLISSTRPVLDSKCKKELNTEALSFLQCTASQHEFEFLDIGNIDTEIDTDTECETEMDELAVSV